MCPEVAQAKNGPVALVIIMRLIKYQFYKPIFIITHGQAN
jgi:hypothetical protein